MMKYRKIIFEISVAIFLIIATLSIYSLRENNIYISLKGNDNITLNLSEKYVDDGVTVLYCTRLFNTRCTNVTKYVDIKNTIDNSNAGEYVVDYKINYKGISKDLKRNVKVIDNIAPVITLTENSNKYTCPNKEYIEDGYTVSDNYDTDLNDKVTVLKDSKGWTYTVSDSSGNTATAYREFIYNDNENPSISLNGSSYVYLKLNDVYNEAGYSANDNCDGDITNKVTINNEIDNTKEGTYKITYSVSDNASNTFSVTRTIQVYGTSYTGKVVYLTFDDGPCLNTEKLLNLLDKYNVKVTFFVTYQFGDKYINYIKEAYNRGHSIGLHTASHVFTNIYSSVDAYFDDLNIIDEVVYNQTGIHSKLIRFPGGSSNTISRFNRGIMTTLTKEVEGRGYAYFDWNVDSNDTGSRNSYTIANNIIAGMERNNYSIVLQHDLYTYSIEALDKVIEYGINNGYTFLPLTTESPTAHHGINN